MQDQLQQEVWTWDFVKDLPDSTEKILPSLDGGVCIEARELKRIMMLDTDESTASYVSNDTWQVAKVVLQVCLLKKRNASVL